MSRRGVLTGAVHARSRRDADYGAIRDRRDAYEDNVRKLLVRADSVSQTVNAYAEREHAECQTPTPATSAAGVQAYGFDVAAANGPRPEAPEVRSRRHEDFDRTIACLERMLAQNATAETDRSAEESRSRSSPSSPPRVALLSVLTLPGVFVAAAATAATASASASAAAENKGLAAAFVAVVVRCAEWGPRQARLLAVGYGRSPRDFGGSGGAPDAVALWNANNPYTPERYSYSCAKTPHACCRARRRLRSAGLLGLGAGVRPLRFFASEPSRYLAISIRFHWVTAFSRVSSTGLGDNVRSHDSENCVARELKTLCSPCIRGTLL